MRYKGHYITLEDPIESNSFIEIQKQIENIGGYISGSDQFKEYETASIDQYNSIGRKCAYYWFSMKDKKWHKFIIKKTDYDSWDDAKNPFKAIAQWILKISGHKAKHDKFTADLAKKIHNLLKV